MVQERVIVGIDVGTTKICVLVGELDRDGKLNIVGVGTCPSGMNTCFDVGQSSKKRRLRAMPPARVSSTGVPSAS